MGYWGGKHIRGLRVIACLCLLGNLGIVPTFAVTTVDTVGDAVGNESIIRWTAEEDSESSLEHILGVLSQKLSHSFSEHDFILQEDRDLAFNHYRRWVQVVDSVPVHGKSIRQWTELGSGKLIQVEAALTVPSTMVNSHKLFGLSLFARSEKSAQQIQEELSTEQTHRMIQDTIGSYGDDPHIRGMDWKDEWQNGELFRIVKVRGKSGTHQIGIHLKSKKVTSHQYRQFPQVDTSEADPSMDPNEDEFTIPARVFPIYEEDEQGHRLARKPVRLKHIRAFIPEAVGDIYAPLKSQHYYGFLFDPILGQTQEGRSKGYWSMSYLKQEARKVREGLPLQPNDWQNGVLLQGKYATINIHPDGIQKFNPSAFRPQFSSSFFPNWLDVTLDGKLNQEMVPSTAYAGKPLMSPEDAWNCPARRLLNHDPAQYMNDGFDELQVYYAINTLFEVLQARGFKDPDLSTRPFNAFLFNPDVAYRDNAFYTDDTINFTTYSPKAQNAARDNGTIWHELGHGVMDRLMGDQLELADTGGLSEGMADFVAAIVIQAVSRGVPFPGSDQFRIINKTGFYLTNEVHDDGEAYGGAMKDFMDSVIAQYGQIGLKKVADVVLEGMRLTRDYPGLTAREWFNHLIFADHLGRPGLRGADELKPFLLKALAGRNFVMDAGAVASFSLVNLDAHEEVSGNSPGTRDNPIAVPIAKNQTAKFQLRVGVKSSESYAFRYPVQIRVQFQGGALQGAIHWLGKEQGARTYTLNSEVDQLTIPLEVSGTCDEVNRADGSCVDYAYLKVMEPGDTEHSVAKKRFYLRIQNPQNP